MRQAVHELVLLDREGRRKFSVWRTEKEGKPGNYYALREGAHKAKYILPGRLPRRLRAIMQRHGIDETAAGPVEGYLPIAEIEHAEETIYSLRKGWRGRTVLEVNISKGAANELEKLAKNRRMSIGVDAYFSLTRGIGPPKHALDCLEREKREVKRAVLLGLERRRRGIDSVQMMSGGGERVLPRDAIRNVDEALKSIEDECVPALVKSVNSDPAMEELRKEHGIQPFTVEELLTIKAARRLGKPEE
jgi:hypothetical protein